MAQESESYEKELLDDTCQAAEIWTANADGSSGNSLKQFPDSLSYVSDPAPGWSSDGSTIFFSAAGELFAISEDGSALTNITNTNAINETHPSLPLLLLSCVDSVSATRLFVEATGGSGTIDVTAKGDCSWNASSTADWITTTLTSSTGSGSVSFTVARHTGSAPRSATLIVAGHLVFITQQGVPARIFSASVDGKRLIVVGESFDPGAVILLNGDDQKTKNDPENPRTVLIGKKTGKKIKPGDSPKVRNPNGAVSAEFIFSGG